MPCRLLALLLFPIMHAVAAEPAQMQMDGPRFVGSVGCKSSSCHGGAGEKRNQFIIWSRQDFHTRAFSILTTARSERMAEALGLPAAPQSARCTICHSPFQATNAERLTSGANPSEGVSCESCHGAAEPWLRGHTRKDWTYATRIGAGMRDLKSFYVRANNCVACHQNLDADIAAAGHPELIFELNRQTRDEPKHWRDPEGSEPRAWLIGQAVALRETSWRLAQNPEPNEQTLGQWSALIWLLSKVTEADKTLPPVTRAAYAEVQKKADALARHAAQANLGDAFARRVLHVLAETEADFTESAEQSPRLLFRRGQRLLLALQSLSRSVKISDELRLLQADLRSPADFQPGDFAAHLRDYKIKTAR